MMDLCQQLRPNILNLGAQYLDVYSNLSSNLITSDPITIQYILCGPIS